MKAYGKLIYKALEEKKGGEFTNEKGENIKYGDSYHLIVDEIQNGSIRERKLKVDKGNTGLVHQLQGLKPYTEIELECEVQLFNNSCKLIPVSLINANSNNK